MDAATAAARIEDAVGHRVDGLLWQTAALAAVSPPGSGRTSAVLRDLRDEGVGFEELVAVLPRLWVVMPRGPG